MADLSPGAQSVLDAAYALPLKNGQPNIAAALRAAADQLYDSASQDYLWKLANELEHIND